MGLLLLLFAATTVLAREEVEATRWCPDRILEA